MSMQQQGDGARQTAQTCSDAALAAQRAAEAALARAAAAGQA
ncbi:hypothetical protein [Delftia lacustris]